MRKGYSYDCQFDWLPLVTPVSATGTSSTIEKSFTSGDTETTSTTCGTKHNNTRDDDDDEDGDEDDG